MYTQKRSKSLNQTYSKQNQRANNTFSPQNAPYDNPTTKRNMTAPQMNGTFNRTFLDSIEEEEDAASIGSFAEHIDEYKGEIRQILSKHNNTQNKTRNMGQNTLNRTQGMPLNTTFNRTTTLRPGVEANDSYHSFEQHMDEYKTEVRKKLMSERKSMGAPLDATRNVTNDSYLDDSRLDDSKSQYCSFEVFDPEWSPNDPANTSQFPEDSGRNLFYDSNIDKPEPVRTYQPLVDRALFEAHNVGYEKGQNKTFPANLPKCDVDKAELNGYMVINNNPCYGRFSGYKVTN